MRYRNRNTGAEIESSCVISGGGWEPVQPAPKPKKKSPKKKESEQED